MPFRGSFSVDEPRGQRWKLGLERLTAGDPVVVRGVRLWLDEPGVVRVEVASAWSDARRLTEDVARGELVRAKGKVEDLLRDAAVNEVVGDRALRYELVNDYDTGTTLICTLTGDQLEWATR